MSNPGVGIGREIDAGERAEAELDAFISRRSRRKDPDEGHALWAEAERAHNARKRAENRAARYAYHAGQAERLRRAMTDLVGYHEREAMKLLEGEA